MFNQNTDSRAAQKEATRISILGAAKQIFETLGYEKATIRRIAEAAGVSAGNVIHHFSDKTELLYEVLYQDLEQIYLNTAEPEKGLGLAEMIFSLFTPYLNYYKEKPGLSRILLKEAFFSEGKWPQKFRAQAARTGAYLTGVLQERLCLKDGPDSVSPEVAAASIVSFYYFSILYWVSDTGKDPESFFRRLTQDYLNLLLFKFSNGENE